MWGGNAAVANIHGSSRHVELVNTPFSTAVQNVEIVGSQAVLLETAWARRKGSVRHFASEAWPTETFAGERDREVFFNGEAIGNVSTRQRQHTDADSIVFFRRSDVIATGDLFDTDHYPVVDVARGGSLQGIIDGSQLA